MGYSVHWQEVVLTKSGETILDVALVPKLGSLHGRVTSASSGTPLSGATVRLGSLTTLTDHSGDYQFVELTPGTYALNVCAPEHEPFEMTLVIGPGAAESAHVNLAPLPASVTVRVIDATTGRPLEGALLTIEASERLPTADYKLLVPLKRSRAYAAVRPRVADLRPTDAWRQDELHFFTFVLRPLNRTEASEPPVAVFAMHRDVATPVSALVITTPNGGGQPEIIDLLSVKGPSHGPSVNGAAHDEAANMLTAATHPRRPGSGRSRGKTA
jgi:hypothetical protein